MSKLTGWFERLKAGVTSEPVVEAPAPQATPPAPAPPMPEVVVAPAPPPTPAPAPAPERQQATSSAPSAVEETPQDALQEAASKSGPLHEQVLGALKKVYDPEIPVNIYDLGLIYSVDIDVQGSVEIDMTLTAPGCPVAQEFPGMVEAEVLRVPGVNSAHVELVWEPPWTPDRMTEAAKLELGML